MDANNENPRVGIGNRASSANVSFALNGLPVVGRTQLFAAKGNWL